MRFIQPRLSSVILWLSSSYVDEMGGIVDSWHLKGFWNMRTTKRKLECIVVDFSS